VREKPLKCTLQLYTYTDTRAESPSLVSVNIISVMKGWLGRFMACQERKYFYLVGWGDLRD